MLSGKTLANVLLGMAIALFLATIFLFVMDSQLTVTFLIIAVVLFVVALITGRKSV